MSRDSVIWWIGMAGAVVVGLAANFSLFPWLPLWAQHWLTMIAFVVGIVSGKLATSPLPGAHEVAVARALQAGEARPIEPPIKAGSVDLTKIKPIFILVAALATFTPSCAGRMSPLQQIQVSHDALATAQDLEVQLCLGVANVTVAAALPTVNHCTTAVATTIGLTDARHQAISRQFVTALTIHKALTAQGAAGATSMDMATLKATITTILNLIAELQPTPDVVRLANTVKAGQVK